MQIFLKSKGNVINDNTPLIEIGTIETRQRGRSRFNVPNPIRKDPLEEFFDLTAKTVKLNSPFMDDVLGINTKDWYKLAIRKQLPFH